MMPFIPTPETFLSLALCGSIRDKIVPPLILADYLLYNLNLRSPDLYTSTYSLSPTNDLMEFLSAVALKTGKLLKGGYVDDTAAAIEVVNRFRGGGLGTWPVDRITPEGFDRRIKEEIKARQRESRSSGDVLELRKSKKSTQLGTRVDLGAGPKGVMTAAIESGRSPAKQKSTGKRTVGKRAVGSRAKAFVLKIAKRGRKTLNRNKGTKSRKGTKQKKRR
jgi:hypothetical protein